MPTSLGALNLKNNVYPKRLVPLENMFSTNDSSKSVDHNHEPYKHNVNQTILVNIGSKIHPKNLCIGAQCTEEERAKLLALFSKFWDIFSSYYKDLRDFDLDIIQHSIPFKKDVNRVRQK